MWRLHAFWLLFTDFGMLNALADIPAQRRQLKWFQDGPGGEAWRSRATALCRRNGVTAYRRIGVSAYRRIGVSAYRPEGP